MQCSKTQECDQQKKIKKRPHYIIYCINATPQFGLSLHRKEEEEEEEEVHMFHSIVPMSK